MLRQREWLAFKQKLLDYVSDGEPDMADICAHELQNMRRLAEKISAGGVHNDADKTRRDRPSIDEALSWPLPEPFRSDLLSVGSDLEQQMAPDGLEGRDVGAAFAQRLHDALAAQGTQATDEVDRSRGPLAPRLPDSEGPPAAASAVKSQTDGFYFYQLTDGQLGFLDKIATKCLWWEYCRPYGGDWGWLPLLLRSVKLEAVDWLSVDDQFRKRNSYLGHLPISGEIAILHPHLPSLVSDATLQRFHVEIEKRRLEQEENEKMQKVIDEEMELRAKHRREEQAQIHMTMLAQMEARERPPAEVEDHAFEFPSLAGGRAERIDAVLSSRPAERRTPADRPPAKTSFAALLKKTDAE